MRTKETLNKLIATNQAKIDKILARIAKNEQKIKYWEADIDAGADRFKKIKKMYGWKTIVEKVLPEHQTQYNDNTLRSEEEAIRCIKSEISSLKRDIEYLQPALKNLKAEKTKLQIELKEVEKEEWLLFNNFLIKEVEKQGLIEDYKKELRNKLKKAKADGYFKGDIENELHFEEIRLRYEILKGAKQITDRDIAENFKADVHIDHLRNIEIYAYDGKHNYYSRMIYCAEFSSKVRPHWRMITTACEVEPSKLLKTETKLITE